LEYKLLIHGGAGVITKENISEAEKESVMRDLNFCLSSGEKVLVEGGSAIDAVCAAVECLENSLNFNAGKGAVFARSGAHLLEASIMDGRTLKAGSVANCKSIKNPILFARNIMERDDIVMLSGDGADIEAKAQGFNMVENKYFDTEFRKKQWESAKKKQGIFLDHSNLKMGTVGAVAIDQNGNLAAATSTGGMTNKPDGRIGDTAIIGAGTYANNKTCAVSCTGTGEFFIRAVTAYDVACLVEFGGLDLMAAGKKAIHERMGALGGDGGVIAIDRNGNFTMPYNSEGMYRGFVTQKKRKIFIWENEELIPSESQ
jgi:beta-aspartyl-peptidase (threonine type)